MAVAFDGSSGSGPSGGSSSGWRVPHLISIGLGSLTRHPGEIDEEERARLDEADRLLRAGVDALIGLAQRTPGFDMTLSVGPGNMPAVRLHYTQEGLVAVRLTSRGKAEGTEAVGSTLDENEIVSELASMLWSGEVQTP